MKFIVIIFAMFLFSCSSGLDSVEGSSSPNNIVEDYNEEEQKEDLFHCISYSDEVADHYTNIEIVIRSVFDTWELDWEIKSNCNNEIVIGQNLLKNGEVNTKSLANASKATPEHGGTITLHDIKLNKLTDIVETCKKEYLLETILAHEFGHLIGISPPHSDSGLMRTAVEKCSFQNPTQENLDSISDEYRNF